MEINIDMAAPAAPKGHELKRQHGYDETCELIKPLTEFSQLENLGLPVYICPSGYACYSGKIRRNPSNGRIIIHCDNMTVGEVVQLLEGVTGTVFLVLGNKYHPKLLRADLESGLKDKRPPPREVRSPRLRRRVLSLTLLPTQEEDPWRLLLAPHLL